MVTESRTTTELMQDLATDLAPVRRVPPLRLGLASVLAVWLGVFVIVGLVHEPWLAASLARTHGPAQILVVLGLIMAAAGGLIAALAGSIPGREATERNGFRAALAGLSLSGIALLAMALGVLGESTALAADAQCFSSGTLMGLAPAVTLWAFLRLGWVQRPRRDAGLALLGAFALGGLMIHSVCSYEGVRHILLGHASIPVVVAVLGAPPLALLLRRRLR
jgi:hypothetical protein